MINFGVKIKMKSKRFPSWAIFLLSIFSLWMLGGYLFAKKMTDPVNANYSNLIKIDSFNVEQKKIISSDGTKINAWFCGNNKNQVVILLAGIHANSSQMIDRAKIYLANNFSVLLPDLRGEGKSDPQKISFGWNERHDLLACVRWLKNNGFQNIAVHGCSLGAATIAYSFDSCSDYKFVVMESPYDNIDHALSHRTFDSGFNRVLFWPVYFFVRNETGINADQLSPLNCVSKYKGPLLYFAGDMEKQIPVEEAQNIFSAFGSTKKTIHFFHGAGHFDFLNFQAEEYKLFLTNFLRTLN